LNANLCPLVEDDSDGPQPEPSQSQAPSSSQNQSTVAPERSLTQYSASEKGEWRKHAEPSKFGDFVGWSKENQRLFATILQNVADMQGDSYIDALTSFANTGLKKIRKMLKSSSTVNWIRIPLDSPSLTENSRDDLMFCWIQVMRIGFCVKPEHSAYYEDILSRLLPKPQQSAPHLHAIVELFHRAEKRTPYGRYPSDELYSTITQYYSSFASRTHVAPYTSLIGPSGIGKTFAISKLASRHGAYVVYANFARTNELSYSERSRIAEYLPTHLTKDFSLVWWWNCFLLIALLEAEVCKESGISAPGFFRLQTMLSYSGYQAELSGRVYKLFRKGLHDAWRLMYDHELETIVKRELRGIAERSQKKVLGWKEALEEKGHNPEPSTTPVAGGHTPRAIICIDETRNLLEDADAVLFRSLREALRSSFQRSYSRGSVELHRP
jgi:hypothetical protein